MNIGNEYITTVEKLLYCGSALAKAENMPVFIKNAAPNDKVKLRITKVNKSYLEGEIVEIIEKSPCRRTPECSLNKICGSCDWQYVDYKEQLNQKQQIIEEAFKKNCSLDVNVNGIIASPKTKEYRCKIQLPYRQTPVSKRLLSGYYKKNSHELINIKYCPMQPQVINEINEFLKQEAQNIGITAYDEEKNAGLLRHVIYRISSDLKEILIIFVLNSEHYPKNISNLAHILCDKYPQIVGICANYNTNKTNVITGKRTEIISGRDYYIETLSKIKYKVSASSFFQVNPYCAQLIFDRVKALINERVTTPSILDAYSGVSSFGIWLSNISNEVTCIEEVKSATSDAIYNCEINNIKNVKIINGDAAKEFEKLIKEEKSFDITITDPPRKGCSTQSVEYLSKLTKKYIVYVSCNPSTLARDVKLLQEKGFELEYVEGADMFPNTYHIETIAVLKRKSSELLN